MRSCTSMRPREDELGKHLAPVLRLFHEAEEEPVRVQDLTALHEGEPVAEPLVERAFRTLRTLRLLVRPVDHRGGRRAGGQLPAPRVVPRRLQDLLVPDIEPGRDVPDGLGHREPRRLGRQQPDEVEGGPCAQQAVIVVDEVDEPVVDPLVVRHVGVGAVDAGRFEQHLLERPALAVEVVVDLARADLVAVEDALLQGGVAVGNGCGPGGRPSLHSCSCSLSGGGVGIGVRNPGSRPSLPPIGAHCPLRCLRRGTAAARSRIRGRGGPPPPAGRTAKHHRGHRETTARPMPHPPAALDRVESEGPGYRAVLPSWKARVTRLRSAPPRSARRVPEPARDRRPSASPAMSRASSRMPSTGLIAISTEIPVRSFTSSESACRVTPSPLAARVTERPRGSRHCRFTMPPGCGGLCIPMTSLLFSGSPHSPHRPRTRP